MRKGKQRSALAIIVLIAVMGIFFVLTELGKLQESAAQLYCEQEQQYMEQFEYNYAMPEVDKLTKDWKAKAEIETNDKVLDAIEPTIIKNNN